MRTLFTIALLALTLAAFPAGLPPAVADTGTWPPAFPGLAPPPAPADNPTTPERVALGRHLFFDGRLSGPGYMSCGTCHQPEHGFSDGRPVAIGVTGQRHTRNTPGLANVGYFTVLNWADPEVTTLEAQSLAPLFGHNPIEMMADGRRQEILRRFQDDTAYRRLFAAAFPDRGEAVDFVSIRQALAAFQRSLISAGSAYDRFVADPDAGALTPTAERGRALFLSDRLACAACHPPPLFTDAATVAAPFHNTGLYNLDGAGGLPARERGLIDRTGAPSDMGRFRTPSLRNVAVTAPYMHDGSLPTLAAVIDHYAAGGQAARTGAPSPLRSPLIAGFSLTDGERNDLIAFLEALTDTGFLEDENLQHPFRFRPPPDDAPP